ncbi:MAG TPA: AraC family ligand binding domain-containing protein [Candidatus Kryptonia bacterium]|nr:AraC family ligand binding domain-containing protein [Candidatus Kryptonia bacterium]
MEARFVDQTESAPPPIDLWPALIVRKEAIDAEIERLAGLPEPANGRRSALIVHPRAVAPGLGLAPGIRVALEVLKPGERTQPIRHNSTQVSFCIQGSGFSVVAGKRIAFDQYDVWNTPSMATYWHVNDRDTLQVRLTYSNAALLEQMNVHVVDEQPPEIQTEAASEKSDEDPTRRNPFGTFRLTDDGAYLMPYEQLISPDAVESKPLHWPWRLVKAHLDQLVALGTSYVGRRLYLLFNPATGRTNGTTQNFFATITIRPPQIVDRPHRHTSAAINYYFAGSGHSVVEGRRYEWKAGDLMFSAPGWGVHNHASHDEPVYELTIQDSPLNIAMESLLWQEDLRQPFRVLGAQSGFATNRIRE